MRNILQSTVGRKQLLSALGLGLMAWSVLHLIGNLAVVAGEAAFNGYAAALAGSPVLWLQRIAFWSLLFGHVFLVVKSVQCSRRARPVRYHRAMTPTKSSTSSRWVRWMGAVLAFFIVWHVAHIYGVGHVSYNPQNPHHNLVAGLGEGWVAVMYLVGGGLFALHLQHAAHAVVSTWGLPRIVGTRGIRRTLSLLPWGVGFGFSFVVAYAFFSAS